MLPAITYLSTIQLMTPFQSLTPWSYKPRADYIAIVTQHPSFVFPTVAPSLQDLWILCITFAVLFHLLSGSYTQMCIHTDESYSPIPLYRIMHSFFWIVHYPFLICNNKIDSRHCHTQWLSYHPWLSSQRLEIFFLSFLFVISLSAPSCRISIVVPRERLSDLPLPRILMVLYLHTWPFQILNLYFNFNS